MNTVIYTPTPNLKESLAFFQKLDFTVIADENATLVADGNLLMEINPDRFVRAGIKLYRNSWSDIAEELQNFTKVHQTETGYFLADPSNVRIYLIEGNSPFSVELPASKSALGNYMGLSLETTDIEESVVIWEKLGFKKSMGSMEQGWVAHTNDDGVTVSFMGPNTCPHLFFNPSLTYFNGGKNLPVIEKIRKAGITIAEEITFFNKEGIVDNVIIREPGGYGFFIFND